MQAFANGVIPASGHHGFIKGQGICPECGKLADIKVQQAQAWLCSDNRCCLSVDGVYRSTRFERDPETGSISQPHAATPFNPECPNCSGKGYLLKQQGDEEKPAGHWRPGAVLLKEDMPCAECRQRLKAAAQAGRKYAKEQNSGNLPQEVTEVLDKVAVGATESV